MSRTQVRNILLTVRTLLLRKVCHSNKNNLNKQYKSITKKHHLNIQNKLITINSFTHIKKWLSTLFLFSTLCYCSLSGIAAEPAETKAPAKVYSIAISQIIEHSALDTVRKSMLKALEEEGFIANKNLKIQYENAQGNMVTSTQIASKVMSNPIDVAIGISTPSAQGLFYEAKKQGKQIPIVFSAVSDPASAKLESSDYPITGITDTAHLEGLLEVMQTLLPNLKTLGIMYNPSESNSVSTVNRLKVLLKAKNIQVVEVTVNKTQDVTQATKSLIGKVDALYFPQDNTIVAAIDTVVNIATQASPTLPVILPIFTNDSKLIQKGVLAAVGYDYEDVGKETGIMVAKILKGENVKDLPIHNPTKLKTVINKPMVDKMGISAPKKFSFSEVEFFN